MQNYENSKDEQEILVISLNIIQIIKLWCNNIDIFISKTEKKDSKIPRNISDDYSEFVKVQAYLQDILKDIYVIK
jgi:hypothetical protein